MIRTVASRAGRPFRVLVAIFVLCVAAAVEAHAVQITDIEARLGLLLLSNGYTQDASGNPVQFSEVSPLLGEVGGGVGLSLSGIWSLRPGLDVYGVEYAETASGKVVPTQIETANAALVVNLLLSSPILATWQATQDLALSGGFSPSILVRFPLIPYGSPDLGAITGYFYRAARFFYPEFTGSVEWSFQDSVHVGATVRVLLPVFHLWDGEGMPFTDQMIVAGALTLRFPLHPKATASAAATQ